MRVSIDGHLVSGSEARIPVTDHGLLYGDGVFEGIRIAGRRLFRLDDHLARLRTGAAAIGLELPGGVDAIAKIAVETARAHDRDEAYVRLIVTRGDGELGVDPTTCPTPRVICIVDDIRLWPAERLREGLDLVTSAWRRPPPDVLDPRVKSLNYLNSVLAKREARLRGADEALLLNAAGRVAEAAVANVFAVANGVLETPPPTEGALAGITRATLLEIAPALGLAVRERPLGRFDLLAADEVLLSGSGAGVVPVARIDDAPIGQPGVHPWTDRLRDAFFEVARTRGTPF